MAKETKLLEDSEILENVIKELNLNKKKFAEYLGVTPAGIYAITNEKRNNISETLLDKIIKYFPQINYWYLKKGELPIILEDKKFIQNQDNLLNGERKVDYNQENFITLRNIERLLTEVVVLLKEQKKANQ